MMTVDLDSLLGHPGRPRRRGRRGRADQPQACRRLACDGAVTRVLSPAVPPATLAATLPERPPPHHDPGGHHPTTTSAARAAWRHGGRPPWPCCPDLGRPSQPLEVAGPAGSSPRQHSALTARDGGWVVPDGQRPPFLVRGHHRWHWAEGGPTDLANLALVCRAHHRAVHAGGWQPDPGPDGHLTATPPHRHHRRHPTAA